MEDAVTVTVTAETGGIVTAVTVTGIVKTEAGRTVMTVMTATVTAVAGTATATAAATVTAGTAVAATEIVTATLAVTVTVAVIVIEVAGTIEAREEGIEIEIETAAIGTRTQGDRKKNN